MIKNIFEKLMQTLAVQFIHKSPNAIRYEYENRNAK